MTESIDVKTARATLSTLIARIALGEVFILTRYGRGVAQLGPIANPDPRLEGGRVPLQESNLPAPRGSRSQPSDARPGDTKAGGPGAPDHVQPDRPKSYAERQPKQVAKDALLNAMRTKKR